MDFDWVGVFVYFDDWGWLVCGICEVLGEVFGVDCCVCDDDFEVGLVGE